jgi:hypothetical protein
MGDNLLNDGMCGDECRNCHLIDNRVSDFEMELRGWGSTITLAGVQQSPLRLKRAYAERKRRSTLRPT